MQRCTRGERIGRDVEGKDEKLLNLTNKVRDVKQITKLYTVFDIMNDEAVGVKSFGQSTAATA
jgi:hypothetical protein